jgi:hypothetical protein
MDKNELNLIEVKLLKKDSIIKETLQRVGIANRKERILYPSCYLYENDNKYYIVHFKELFLLDKEDSYNNISEKDIERKNAIIYCLYNWGLVDVDLKLIEPHNERVFVLNHSQKRLWDIRHKISI